MLSMALLAKMLWETLSGACDERTQMDDGIRGGDGPHLFRETTIGKPHAFDLVQCIGYGGALVIAWFWAHQLAAEPPNDWKWLMPYRALILPVTPLAILAISYGVLLFICDPFLSKSGEGIYNWIFIAAIVASSIWLILSWVQKSAPLVAATDSRKLRKAA
jgi:hypothetical protein